MAIPAADVAPVLVLPGPVGRALARQMKCGAASEVSALERIRHLEQRPAERATGQPRIAGVENRLEFAARLLTSTDAQRLAPGVPGR